MLHKVVHLIRAGLANLPTFARGGAWLFAAGSLLALFWVLIETGGGFGASARVLSAKVDGVEYGAPLLSYSGFFGGLLLWIEFLGVAAAIALSQMQMSRRRRVGHGMLIAWAALWAIGALRLAVLDPGYWTFQFIFLLTLCACTILNAWRHWPSLRIGPDEATHDDPSAAFDHLGLATDSIPAPSDLLQRAQIRGSSRTIALN